MLVVILILLYCFFLFFLLFYKFKYYSYIFNIFYKYFIIVQYIYNDLIYFVIFLRGRGRFFILKQFCIFIGWNDKGSIVRFCYFVILQFDYEVFEDVFKLLFFCFFMMFFVFVEDDQVCLIGYDNNRFDIIVICINYFFVNLFGMFLKVFKCGFYVFFK